jgi:DNA repair protein RecO (recombination protein O)
LNNRRILLLFSKKYGKISAGITIAEKGKGKQSLAMKPFTYGRYELFKGRDIYNINAAEVLKSFYKIGEDVDKYMSCSYILEFTERLLPENQPAPALFELLLDFLTIIERRNKKYASLVAAFQLKALQHSGNAPQIKACVNCGSPSEGFFFSIRDGGILCSSCRNSRNNEANIQDSLIYDVDFGIVNIISYILDNPIASFEKLALDDLSLIKLQQILKSYILYHFDIEALKSEAFLLD